MPHEGFADETVHQRAWAGRPTRNDPDRLRLASVDGRTVDGGIAGDETVDDETAGEKTVDGKTAGETLVERVAGEGVAGRAVLDEAVAGQAVGERATDGEAIRTVAEGIVKELPPELFIAHGTNAEMRWEAVRDVGYHVPNERFSCATTPRPRSSTRRPGGWSCTVPG
ncbi:hypothetical protein ACFQX6_64325 [Streptosporangium lutulentum]